MNIYMLMLHMYSIYQVPVINLLIGQAGLHHQSFNLFSAACMVPGGFFLLNFVLLISMCLYLLAGYEKI